ncbi:MAG: FmdE family protein [Methanoregula sp.]|jgi:formylmethanofuran dehydrogenase subunit E
MSEFDEFLKKSRDFHGHLCGGIVLGTRLTLAGLRELGINPREPIRDLIVYMEIDRCGTDAVQAITGCSLGHRSLKHMDFGKFAATFVNMKTNQAVRVSVQEKNREQHMSLDPKDTLKLLSELPESDLLKIERVKLSIPKEDQPGLPVGSAVCSQCGENISDNRHVVVNGKVLCRNCANGSYYTVIS